MIPKVIHLCWLSGDPYPENIKKCINSMYNKLPEYEIKIWTKENFNIDEVIWVKEAFDNRKYAFAADYIRFWSLYNYGGIYLDSDVEVLKTFDECLDNKSFTGFEYLNIPEAAVVGAEKGCKWIKECLDWYNGKHFVNLDGTFNTDVVPNLVKLVLEKVYNKKIFDNNKIQNFGDLTLYPYYYFSPKNYFNGKIKTKSETICIHRFASAWGPKKKRAWTLVLHQILINLVGKHFHDVIYRKVRKHEALFNGKEL